MTEVVLTKEAQSDVLSLPEVKRGLLIASIKTLQKNDYQELELSKDNIIEKDIFVKSIDNYKIFMSQQRNSNGKFTLIILRIVSNNEIYTPFIARDSVLTDSLQPISGQW